MKKENELNNNLREDTPPDIPPIEEIQNTHQNSRLYRVKESQLKRNILVALAAISVIGIIMFFAGPTLLIQFSVLLDRIKNADSQQVTNKEEQVYIQPPRLNKSIKTTNEATISLSGTAKSKQTIELYVNNSLTNTTQAGSESKFQFDKVNLNEGKNTIKARALVGKNKSGFSDEIEITYREKAPDIEISSPHEGDAFTGDQTTLKVTGKTASYARVTVNEAWAVMDDEGNFQYTYIMQNGENKLRIIAADEAGNKTEKEIKFNYSP